MHRPLARALSAHRLAGALFLGADPNFAYLLGAPLARGHLWVPARGTPVLLTSPLEGFRGRYLRVRRTRTPLEELDGLVRGRIGVNAAQLPLEMAARLARRARLIDIGPTLLRLRARKTRGELVKLSAACRLTDRVLAEAFAAWPFSTEGALKRFLKARSMALGGELSFEPIVASGRHGAVPHWAGDGPIRRGFLVLDFGVRLFGYCADETRTVFVGTPTASERVLYEAVRRAQALGMRLARPGAAAKAIDAAVRAELGSREKYFTHGLGHGVGVEVHEYPTLNRRSTDLLEAGMAITIEPGYYRGRGIRIEDVVVVGARPRLLTRTPKALRCLPLPRR